MRQKLIKILLLVLLTSFIVGCGSNNKEVIRTDVHTGNGVVTVEFIDNLPPPKVYSGEEIQIGLRLINKGAYEVQNGIIKVTGDPGYLTFENGVTLSKKINKLYGKTNYDPRDTEEIFTFSANSDFPDKGFSEHDSNIFVNLCYDYNNIFSDQICVDTNQYGLKETETTCETKKTSYGGQGGPVGIASVEPKMLLKDDSIYPQFRIEIKNFGSGQIFKFGNSNEFCGSKALDNNTMNMISITNIEFSDMILEDFDCFPKELTNIKLRNGETTIVCTLKEGNPKRLNSKVASYTTNLLIEFNYGYSESKSKSITLMNLGDLS